MINWKFCGNIRSLLALSCALSIPLCLPTKSWNSAEPAAFLTQSQESGRVLMFNWWAYGGWLLSEHMPNFSEHYSFPSPDTRQRKCSSSAHPCGSTPLSRRGHLQRCCFSKVQCGMLSGTAHVFRNAAEHWMPLLVLFGMLQNTEDCCHVQTASCVHQS